MSLEWKSDHEIKIQDGMPKTVNWVRFRDDGQLEVEHYDCSSRAESATGGEVAWFVRVCEGDIPSVAMALGIHLDDLENPRREILARIGEKFDSAYTIRRWFETSGIPFTYERDPWP